MPGTTDERPQGPAPEAPRGWRRWAWFVGLWLGGVLVLGTIGGVLKWVLG